MDAQLQTEIRTRMRQPEAYPHPVGTVELRETHISLVFLTGELVYKFKKSVNFGFLDFTTLDKRYQACKQEAELNRRLTRDVYEGIRFLRRGPDGSLAFSPAETPEQGLAGLPTDARENIAECCVVMRQLPDACNIATLFHGSPDAPGSALNREARCNLLRALGRKLAAFYTQPRPEGDAGIASFGRREQVFENVDENFEQVEPYLGRLLPAQTRDFLRESARSYLEIHAALFDERVAKGWIRDGHGDLRLDHVYALEGAASDEDSLQVIDCIEFNERFRYGDVAADLAFLQMDLERRGFLEESRVLLAAYARAARDPQIYRLCDFYAAYRSMVRAKIACFRSDELPQTELRPVKREVNEYVQLAWRFALRFARPTLYVFLGLPASGKSHLARRFCEAFHIPSLATDALRKENSQSGKGDAGGERTEAFNAGRYREEQRNLIYGRMFLSAQDFLRDGRSVALDASFSKARWREEARRLAREYDAAIVFLECRAGEEVTLERLARREGGSGLSDARAAHWPQLKAAFEPTTELPDGQRVTVATDGDEDESFYATLAQVYALRAEQCVQTDDGRMRQ